MKKIISLALALTIIFPTISAFAADEKLETIPVESKGSSVKLSTQGPIPTLVSGRLAGYYTSDEEFFKNPNDDFDGWHKTAKLIFEETEISSWWEERDTELVLPDGVKFIEVKISDASDDVFDFNKNYGLNGTYKACELKGEKLNYVKVSGAKVIISDLSLKTSKKGKFTMDSWVSIESGFEGDITITAKGTGLYYESLPCVVAKAISPITIDTEITNLKIGYQWQKTADITINETDAGRLLKDKQIEIDIYDYARVDEEYFAPDWEVEKFGDISFEESTFDEGKFIFTIDKASSSKASSIKLSNLYLKIGRTVVDTYDVGKILVGGSGICANYVGVAKSDFRSNAYKAYDPIFSTPGITADYYEVSPTVIDESRLLSETVSTTIGSNVILVGRENPIEVQMDTAPYISEKTNSVMVPIKFISTALGVSEDEIKWDEESRTITIKFEDTVIQMQADSYLININGETRIMYTPEIEPRKATVEIKDNRAFIPFKHLVYALGIYADWDETTKSILFNYYYQ